MGKESVVNFDSVKSAASSMVGNIEKAIIEIEDNRGKEPVIEPPVSVQTKSKAVSLGGAVGSLADQVASVAVSVAEEVKKASAEALGGTKKRFFVQFNPSELSLTGYGGGMRAKTDYSSGHGGITFDSVDVRITLSVRLIFDKVDPQDAFLADKMNLSVTSMAVGAAKAGMAAMGKKDNSVQTEVEGFIAALRSPSTRKIAFYWGSLCYSGVLNKIGAQYTMFNVNGQPIRGIVQLSLVCADEKVIRGNMGFWQEQYKKAFQGQNQSYVKAAQKAGSLVNFNL